MLRQKILNFFKVPNLYELIVPNSKYPLKLDVKSLNIQKNYTLRYGVCLNLLDKFNFLNINDQRSQSLVKKINEHFHNKYESYSYKAINELMENAKSKYNKYDYNKNFNRIKFSLSLGIITTALCLEGDQREERELILASMVGNISRIQVSIHHNCSVYFILVLTLGYYII